ncbi:MAG: amidohydrolase family protein [Planctomycetes bacterium]|nr:amidohydrolase family protein [Planctomycetota bacterium]
MDYAVRVSHYVDPVTFELQRDVILLISGSHVAEVIVGGEVSGGLDGLAEHTLDFDSALCLPGFVNSHAHLDLSHLHRQVPNGLSFPEWAPAVIAGRALPQPMIDAGIDDACRMLVASGTTSVLDISVNGDSAPFLSKHGLQGLLALEVLGWSGDAAENAMQHADEIVRAKFTLDRDRLGEDAGDANAPVKLAGVDYAFSPHAPYSTSMELYQHAFGRAFGEGRVCTTHVAESREEEQFIRDGSGPLRDLLGKLGIDLSSFKGFDKTPIALLLDDWLMPWLPRKGSDPVFPSQKQGLTPSPGTPQLVLVHCNYAREDDFDLLANTKPSVCWCPRSHAYFGHEPWPLAKMRESGVNLVLGTDSLASNDGLDMLGEIREAANHPDADVTELFKAATVNGRKALGVGQDAADLAIWGLPPGDKLDELLQGMLKNETPLYAGFARGNLIARAI